MQHLTFSKLHGKREVMKCKVNGGHKYGMGSHPIIIGVHPRKVEKRSKIISTDGFTTAD